MCAATFNSSRPSASASTRTVRSAHPTAARAPSAERERPKTVSSDTVQLWRTARVATSHTCTCPCRPGAPPAANARGNVFATADGPATPPAATPPAAASASRDPALELIFPADGDYYLVLTDANDSGGAATHPYLLEITKS